MSQQNSTAFYYCNGERVPLVLEPTVYAVKFKPGSTSRGAAFSLQTSRFLREDSQAVGFIPHYGLQIYQTDARDRSSRALAAEPDAAVDNVRALDHETAVEFAAMAYRRPQTSQSTTERTASRTEDADLLFITRRFLAQFKPGVTRSQIEALNAQHQVEIIEALGYAENGYLLEAPEAAGDRSALTLANRYYESELTLFAHPDYIWRRHFRATALAAASTQRPDAAAVSDRASYLAEQWHLKTAKVTDAWNTTQGSANITIAILDDGTDTTHPEFAGKVVAEYDFANHVANGNPKTASDSHGTACAGVATAKGVKSFGAAPNCQLIAVRTPDFLGVADEANMFRWVADQGADIISCSWGPADGNGTFDPLPDNVRSAIHYCATSGRGGQGIPIFWAAGNGDESVSLDGYAANPEVIAVAASTSNERRAWYSDFGPEVWICAPSSGDGSLGDRRIFTTDRQGGLGYNTGLASKGDVTGDYTNDFGGTSSATPLVAGIVGLMLSANEKLTPDDVKDILKRTADKIGSASDYGASGHSNLYGYGRVNAQKAVEAAQATGSPTTPSIRGSVSLPRSGSAPTFEVNLGGRRSFAIEVATQASLFDGDAQGADRTEQNFYGSWQDGPLLTSSPYTLPTAVWQRLRQGDRLYYRAHVADSSAWANYAVTLSDSQASSAPFIQISAPAMPTPEPDNQPSIQAPATASRASSAPTFAVNSGGRRFFAIEVATQASLFDGDAQGSDRTEHNFYGSWQDSPLLTSSPYTLPAAVWQRLKQSDRLYYRAHVADSSAWVNYAVTISDAQASSAPFIRITGEAVPATDTSDRILTFPSGATFAVVSSPADTVDYSDPVSSGQVPLIEVAERLEENLSANFKVNEFAARKLNSRSQKVRYARISPDLVAGLQRLRDRIGASITINSAYRYPALNQDVDGASHSQHVVGHATDIRCSRVTPLELAEAALEEIGCNIGIGLGKNSVHLDLRGTLTSWTYQGAVMDEAEFDRWVRDRCAQLNRYSTRAASAMQFDVRGVTANQPHAARLESSRRHHPPVIIGPEIHHCSADPPTFQAMPGQNAFYAVEVATHWRLFNQETYGAERQADNFFAAWHTGMNQAEGLATTYSLPELAWQRLRSAARLYYRLVTASAERSTWPDYETSTPDESAAEAAWIDIVSSKAERSLAEPRVKPLLTQARQVDESFWRG